MILCWFVGCNTPQKLWQMRTQHLWKNVEGKLKFLATEKLPCVTSSITVLTWIAMGWNLGLWWQAKPASYHEPWNRYGMITHIICNTTLPLMRSFNLSIATEILTGISGFGISALLLLILWRWCVTVLDENNNHVSHFLLDPNISQFNSLTSSSWVWRFLLLMFSGFQLSFMSIYPLEKVVTLPCQQLALRHQYILDFPLPNWKASR